MPQSVAHDPDPHSIPRRTFLKVAGGTAALSGLEESSRPAAPPLTRSR
jgi:hypothetical protein